MNDPLPNKSDIQALLRDYSLETTPKSAREIGDFSRWLRPGTQVYVTFLPGSSIESTLETAAVLKQQGMRPVPHIALRNIESEAQLRRVFGRMCDLGIRDLLLIAGALRHAKGPYASVRQLLEDGILDEYAFTGIGFAGHPEGSPDINAAELRQVEAFKYGYARGHERDYWLVSQFCFAAAPIIAWQKSLLARDIHFPLRVGVAGLATVGTLLKHAKACGIGPSISYLLKNSRGFRHLMSTSAPDGVMTALAAFCAAEPGQCIAGLHFYPLGGFQRTVEWIQAIEAGHFELNGAGFDVY